MSAYDIAIVGSGPGGYVAAIRAAQLGLKVAVIERAELGGICANWGCIPTKALLRSAEVLELIRHAEALGLRADHVGFDYSRIIARSRAVAAAQAKGVAYLFKKNTIAHLAGTARLEPPRRLLVDGQLVEARHVILATGARPRALPHVEHDGDRVISYREAMTLDAPPRSLVVIGAGAIGVEFAYFYAVLGSRVTLVEAMQDILPVEDEEISRGLARSLSKRGIEIHTSCSVEKVEKTADEVHVTVVKGGERRTFTAERTLLAVGVRGNVEGLGLEALGVKLERGFIAADRQTYETNVPGVFAIGDVAGPPLLAHKASAEGVACVERLADRTPRPVAYHAIPSCTYCRPGVASVGLTEKQARVAGYDVKVGRFPWKASGKAAAVGETEGFVKVVVDGRYGELLGAHLLGGPATDLVAELGLARTSELTSDELLTTVHAHPTFAEGIKEAIEDAVGHAIHL